MLGSVHADKCPAGGVFVAADVHYLASGAAQAAAVVAADAAFAHLMPCAVPTPWPVTACPRPRDPDCPILKSTPLTAGPRWPTRRQELEPGLPARVREASGSRPDLAASPILCAANECVNVGGCWS